jgi:fumarate reductase subunit C
MATLTRTAPYRLNPFWWLAKRNYLIFMLRELSPVFIALCFIRILRVLSQASPNAGSVEAVMAQVPVVQDKVQPDWAALATAPAIAFAVISLAFALLHSVTFFQAGAVIMPLKVAGKPVPGSLMVLGNLGAMVGFAALLTFALVKL